MTAAPPRERDLIARARRASWTGVILMGMGLTIAVGASLLLGHYAETGRGNDNRGTILMLLGLSWAVSVAGVVAAIVAIARRPRHWTTWIVLAITVLAPLIYWYAPRLF